MRPGQLRVVPAAALTTGQLDQARAVYYEAFPPQLRVPFAGLTTPGPVDLMLVAAEGSEPVAFAAMLRLRQEKWTFLRYYGVAAERRRQGIGLAFWKLLHPALARAGWPGRVVFEVEDPRDAEHDAGEYQIRTGRIAFWAGCGARLLAIDRYVMPDISGLAAPERMRLMAYDPAEPGEMPPARVAGLVAALYAERYGLGAENPLVQAALASVRSDADMRWQ